MSKQKKNIDQLTPDLIQRYLDGTLSEAEQYQVERLLEASPFEAEAMEGFQEHSDSLMQDLEQLNRKLEQRIGRERQFGITYWVRIAASVLLLCTIGYSLYTFLGSDPTLKKETIAESAQPSAEQDEPTASSDTTIKPEETSKQEDSSENYLAEHTQEREDNVSQLQNEVPVTEAEESVDLDLEIEPARSLEPVTPEPIAEVIPEVDTNIETTTNELKGRLSGTEIDRSRLTSQPLALEEEAKLKKALSQRKTAPAAAMADEELAIAGASDAITGRVISSKDGAPLAGVNVLIKGTDLGTLTDTNGNFRLESNIVPGSELVVSFIGMEPEELEVESGNEMIIALDDDTQSLSEVVVVGYGVNEPETPEYQSAFPEGGMREYRDYLEENITVPLPEDRVKVVVRFTITELGEVTDFDIRRSGGEPYDSEAIRLIKEGPDWTPAQSHGEPISTRGRVAVKFEK